MSANSASFLSFWASLLLKPRTFFRIYLADAYDRPPYFGLAMLLYCVGYGIERVDKQLTKGYVSHRPERVEWLNHWPTYWIMVTVAGFLGGFLMYLVAGWFYHVRLRWCGASRDMTRARNLYLYSSVIVSVACVIYALVGTLAQPAPYVDDSNLGTASDFGSFLLLICLFYSVFVSYCGVTTITDANPEKARLWFLILPLLLYGLALVALVGFMAYF